MQHFKILFIVLLSLTGLQLFGAAGRAGGGAGVEAEVIDLHAKRIGPGTLKDVFPDILPKAGSPSKPVILDLSENYFGDDDAYFLADVLTNPKLITQVRRVKLANNRIGNEGLLCFAKLLQQGTFEYLDLSINGIDMEGMRSLTALLEPDVKDGGGTPKAEILSKWLAKVIFMPKGWNFDDVPLPKAHREAHKAYYRE